MGIVLRYSRADGSQQNEVFGKGEEIVDLSSRDIINLDLSPLRANSKLRELHLNDNQLPMVDLEPLSKCTNLRSLHLQDNRITRIDYTPLIPCSKLSNIWLDDDVERETLLSGRVIKSKASETLLDQIDTFDSLSYLPSLVAISYVLPFVKKHEPEWKMAHLFHNALELSGFGWLGFLDMEVSRQRKLLEELGSADFSERLQDEAILLACSQIDNGGPTINLDIESMNLHGELAIRIDDVLELRGLEMENVQVPILQWAVDNETIELLETMGEDVHTHYADLSLLWLKAYGYEALESLHLGTTCDITTFSKVENSLESLGFNIETYIDPTPYKVLSRSNRRVLKQHGIKVKEPEIELPTHISMTLIEYIWQLAQFRNQLEE